MYRIALDAMGGDHAPGPVVHGAYLAVKKYPVHITLVGQIDIVRKEAAKYKDWPESKVSFHNASEVVGMSESPSISFRRKKHSSIRVGLSLVKEGVVDGFVSAGNTGAVMAASILLLGKTNNVERPAIATVFPSKKGPVVVLDMGSNVDCKASYLEQFAVMGSCLAETVLKKKFPKIGLLNIGEEKGKGNSAAQEAYDLIKKQPLNFVGNIEGKDIILGKTEVVVCDGFVGNSILKFGEGIVSVFFSFFKEEAKSSLISLLGMFLLRPALKRLKKEFNYEEYGGAPLLGVNGVSIVAHGSSSAKAIKNAIATGIEAIETNMVKKINGAL